MDAEQKDKIIKILKERGATLPCSRCGHKNFTLVDGYFNQVIQEELMNGIVIGGPTIPSVGVVCNNCGLIYHHAVGVFGLINTESNEEKNETA